jgi:hypothetical protein
VRELMSSLARLRLCVIQNPKQGRLPPLVLAIGAVEGDCVQHPDRHAMNQIHCAVEDMRVYGDAPSAGRGDSVQEKS